jgi:Pyruvate/2-oxoacid:ferredoxin oxidoreductase delta subunit
MKTRVLRKIVKIDENKCNGCGACIISCAEGALRIVDGKAKLMSEKYCDGLGACLGKCPQDAITVVDAEAEEFDEEATRQHLDKKESVAPASENLPCGCPSATVQNFEKSGKEEAYRPAHQPSMLSHWPVQLTLVPAKAPFLQGADVLLAAHCVPFAYAGFHQDFLRDHALLIACPKLDDFSAHLRKLTDILRSSDVRSITVAYMEVPCCSGLVHMAERAIRDSGKDIPLREVTIGVQGEVKQGQGHLVSTSG